MHVKNIHSMIEKLSEVTKCELDKGIENIDTKEMGEVADIIKDLAEAEYYAKISKAMDESEYGEDYDYMGAYDEHERKGYRGQPRDSRGRYMSRRGRRGYEDMMMYDEDWDDMERMRDMDRVYGRMGYSGSGSSSMGGSSSQGGQSSGGMSGGSSGGSSGGQMGYSESGRGSQSDNQSQGRYERAKRGYEETKAMHKDNSPESKQARMKEIEKMSKELEEELKEMLSDASQEEKSLIKQKLSATAQKI